MEYSILNKVTVRISNDNKSVGSGVVFNSGIETYIITAKHCIKDTDKSLKIDFYDSVNEIFISENFNVDNFDLLQSDNPKIDIVLIRIKNKKIEQWKAIPEVKFANSVFDIQKNFVFRGFPKAYNNEKPVNINVELIDQNNNFFIIKPNDEIFDSSTVEHEENMQGLSGSGVFFTLQSDVYLIGIISKFIGEFLRFKAFDIAFIKSFIPKIKIYNKEEIPFESLNFELLQDFKRQLNESKKYIFDFKPKTALEELERIKIAVENSLLPYKEKETLNAEFYYLKGVAQIALENSSNEPLEFFIKAYNINSDNIEYQERAAQAFYKFKNEEKAFELSEKVLQKDDYNARIWSLKLRLSPNTEDIPEPVKKKPRFIYNKFISLFDNKEIASITDLQEHFGHIPDTIPTPKLEDINFENYQYYLFTAIYFLNSENEKIRILKYKNEIPIISEREKKGVEIINVIYSKFAQTEIEDTNLFQQAKFYHELAKYKNNPTKRQASRLADLFIDEKLISQTLMKVFDIVFALLDHELYDDAIQIIDKSEFEKYDINFILIKATTLQKLEKEENAKECFIKYLHKIKEGQNELDEVAFQNLMLTIEQLQKHEYDDNEIYTCLQNKTFEKKYLKDLIEGFAFKLNLEKRGFCKEKAETVFTYWKQLTLSHQVALISIYAGIGDLDKAIELFRQIIDIKDTIHLSQYINLLWYSGKHREELLERLEFWRNNYQPRLDYLKWEISINQIIDNYPRIEEICKLGLTKFIENNELKLHLIDVLHKQNKTDELAPLLDDSIYELSSKTDEVFYLAAICIYAKKYDLSLELAYRELKKYPENPEIKMSYWGITNKIESFKTFETIDVVELNTIVETEINNEKHYYDVMQDGFNSNPIVKAIFKKRIGETIEIKSNFQECELKIVGIYNKYIGEVRKILLDVEKPFANGLPLKSVSIPKDDNDDFNIDEFNSKLREQFGNEGLIRKIENERVIEEYKNKEIGISQLCNYIFQGNYFDCYDAITSDINFGIIVQPLIKHPNYKINHDTSFVLDFSAILLFHELSESIDFTKFKFYISQSTKDIIVHEVYNLETDRSGNFSMSILPDKVVPFFYPENHIANRLKKVRDILHWVERFCKMDYIFNFINEDRIIEGMNKKLTEKYFINTMLISTKPNRFLISDDLMVNNLQAVPTISTEFFFKLHNDKLWEIAKSEMIELNYVGLTLTAETLYNSFEKGRFIIKNKRNSLQNALKSLQGSNNPNVENINESIRFIKDLFSIKIDLPLRVSLTKQVFIAILKEPYFDKTKSNLKVIYGTIESELHLLGDAPKVVKECLNSVIRDLSMKFV